LKDLGFTVDLLGPDWLENLDNALLIVEVVAALVDF